MSVDRPPSEPAGLEPPASPTADAPTSGADGAHPVGADPDAIPETLPSIHAPNHARIDFRGVAQLALGIAGGILLAGIVGNVLGRLQQLVVVLLISVFLSFAMEPAVQYLARRGMRRGFGTMLVFLGALLMLVGFLAAMAPLVITQVRNLADAVPDVVAGLSTQAQNLPGEFGAEVSTAIEEAQPRLTAAIPDLAGRLGGGLLGFSSTVFGMVFQLLTVGLITFYLVADGPKVRRALVARLEPEDQTEVLTIWELAVGKTGGYVYSRVLTAVASTIFHIAVFSAIKLPYSAALGVWVGIISSLIPVVGTYLAGALPLIIALANDPVDAVWVLVAIIVYQQIENYLVAPRITAKTMELHPAMAFLSVLIGGALLGAVGALLALPAAAVVSALVSAYGERHELVTHALLDETVPEGRGAKSVDLKTALRPKRERPEGVPERRQGDRRRTPRD